MKNTLKQLAFLLLLLVVMGSPVIANEIIKPEVTTAVTLSSTDVNRIFCASGEINDVFYSQEKGLKIHSKGQNAWVKYLIRMKDNRQQLITKPTEIHIVCNGEVYSIVAKPEPGDTRTIRLGAPRTDRIKANLSLMGGMDLEEQVLMLTQSAYKDDLPEGFSVTQSTRQISVAPTQTELERLFKAIKIVERRIIRVEGIGMRLKEYTVDAEHTVDMLETDFLQPSLGSEILGVTVHPLKLGPGEQARLFVVERVVN